MVSKCGSVWLGHQLALSLSWTFGMAMERERDRERERDLGMVYTTHLLWFRGGLLFVLPTLVWINDPQWFNDCLMIPKKLFLCQHGPCFGTHGPWVTIMGDSVTTRFRKRQIGQKQFLDVSSWYMNINGKMWLFRFQIFSELSSSETKTFIIHHRDGF